MAAAWKGWAFQCPRHFSLCLFPSPPKKEMVYWNWNFQREHREVCRHPTQPGEEKAEFLGILHLHPAWKKSKTKAFSKSWQKCAINAFSPGLVAADAASYQPWDAPGGMCFHDVLGRKPHVVIEPIPAGNKGVQPPEDGAEGIWVQLQNPNKTLNKKEIGWVWSLTAFPAS